ncbi:MAG: hypothetical protein ACK5L2_05305 [Planctomyces sp.]
MPDRTDNPFAVPQSLQPTDHRPQATESGPYRFPTRALRTASALAFLLHAGFTTLLLALAIASWRSLQATFFFGCSTIVFQSAITLVLLATGGKVTNTLLINGAILLPLLCLTLLARYLARKLHHPPPHN